jgi:hypothetical protein
MPRAIISSTALQQRSVFHTFQRTAFCIKSSGKSMRRRRISAAALLTKVSIWPNSSRARRAMASATPGSLRSPPTASNDMPVSSRNSRAETARHPPECRRRRVSRPLQRAASRRPGTGPAPRRLRPRPASHSAGSALAGQRPKSSRVGSCAARSSPPHSGAHRSPVSQHLIMLPRSGILEQGCRAPQKGIDHGDPEAASVDPGLAPNRLDARPKSSDPVALKNVYPRPLTDLLEDSILNLLIILAMFCS